MTWLKSATRMPSRGRLILILRAVRDVARGDAWRKLAGKLKSGQAIDVEAVERAGTRLAVADVDFLEPCTFVGGHLEQREALLAAQLVACSIRGDQLRRERAFPH